MVKSKIQYSGLIAIAILLLMMRGVGVTPAHAHANLVRSNPAANQVLESAPAVLRLWYTEALEPEFSTITLRDEDGNRLDTPEAAVDEDDPTLLTMPAADLPDGIYTVTWRVVSSVDGHQTQGSFAFSIGVPFSGLAHTIPEEEVPWEEVPFRAFNVLSMALGVGSLGFWLFVYQPTYPQRDPQVEKRLRWLIGIGWGLLGIGGVIMLLLQAHIAAETITPAVIQQVAMETRFGSLWLFQMSLWLVMGAILLLTNLPPTPGQPEPPINRVGIPLAFIFGVGMLLLHSLRGHASAAYDFNAAIGAQWLHLTATVIWLGGLIQFINVALLRPSVEILGRLTAAFSNVARMTVITLILTGIYIGWLHVGSWRGLTETAYGQALLIKGLLALPILGMAAVNLLITQRRLAQGEMIWAGRLRGLIGAEILLLIGVVGVVSVMTATAPARATLAQLDSLPEAPEPHPFTVRSTADGLTVNLTVTPGWVGENDFLMQITDAAGQPIEDASLIRLRFENQQQNLGESELRPEHRGDGVYGVRGANLSVPGNWRIRATIQRPQQFDVVTDLEVNAPSAPLLPPLTVIDPNDLPRPHALILLGLGLAAVGISGFFLGQSSLQSGAGLLATGLAALGFVFLFYGANALEPESTQAASAPPDTPNPPIKMAFEYGADLPYLLRADGTLQQPTFDGRWHKLPFEHPVNDVLIDPAGIIYAATDAGLFAYYNDQWHEQDQAPVEQVVSGHGYYFLLQASGLRRGIDRWEALTQPSPSAPAQFVMLGDHRHVLRSGRDLAITPDLGLAWENLSAPLPVEQIATSPEGNLIAVTETHLITWDGSAWQNYLPFPAGGSPSILRVFADQLFAIAGGRLYRQAGTQWEEIALDESAYFTLLSLQFNQKIWALDLAQAQLWWSADGLTWQVQKTSASFN